MSALNVSREHRLACVPKSLPKMTSMSSPVAALTACRFLQSAFAHRRSGADSPGARCRHVPLLDVADALGVLEEGRGNVGDVADRAADGGDRAPAALARAARAGGAEVVERRGVEPADLEASATSRVVVIVGSGGWR